MEKFDVHWYGVLNLAAGIWLLFTHILSIADVPVMCGWSAYVLGSYIATLSAMTLQQESTLLHGANAGCGLAVVASPFLFGFAGDASMPHFLGVGLFVAATSAWAAVTVEDEEGTNRAGSAA
jgi:hypothetical protein